MRTLNLKRETLTDLTPDELSAVVAASAICPVIEKVKQATDKFVDWPTEEGCTPANGHYGEIA